MYHFYHYLIFYKDVYFWPYFKLVVSWRNFIKYYRFYNGDILKFKDDMAFVKPTLFIAVPRILNRIVEQV